MKKLILLSFFVSLKLLAYSQGNICQNANFYCTGDSNTYNATINVPDLGGIGCLWTTPNPAWFYMQVVDTGDITLKIYSISGVDVDFICWGPFSSLVAGCSSNLLADTGIDCSYSTASTEFCDIPHAQLGEVYILLVTNYANVQSTISIKQINLGDTSGSCNCNIPSLICKGDTLNLISPINDTTASYLWVFQNGDSLSVQNPVVYNIDSTFNGILTHHIIIGSDTVFYNYNLTVEEPPVSSFHFIDMGGTCYYFSNQCPNYDTIYWDFGDSYTSNDVSPTHCYLHNGVYIVTQTVINACGSGSSTDTINIEVGIEESDAIDFTAYPNPGEDKLEIMLHIPPTNSYADIISLEGVLINRIEILQQKTTLNISNLSNGVYILKINTAGQSSFVKFVKM